MYNYYCFKQTGSVYCYEGRYYNCNSRGICIVAVVTKGVDWAAYIGADDGWQEHHCLEWTAEYGAKLSREDAKQIFPDIKLPYRS